MGEGVRHPLVFIGTRMGCANVARAWPDVQGVGSLTGALGWLDNKVPTIKGRKFSHEIIANLTPGITVALVSLPLSISLAIAADATPVQGIVTAVWAGLSSAVLGGSHYNIVGPTGALSGILSSFSVRYGPSVQPLLAMLSGVFCFMVWVFHLERYFVFIPGAVMHGWGAGDGGRARASPPAYGRPPPRSFTLGVAFIITLNQLNFATGLPPLKRHEKFLDNIYESITHLHLTSGCAGGGGVPCPSALPASGRAELPLGWCPPATRGSPAPPPLGRFAVVFFLVSYVALTRLQKRFNKVPWAIVLAVFGIVWGIVQVSWEDMR